MTILEYLTFLERCRLHADRRHPWAAVGAALRVQGWKLHVSSIPAEAPRLLRRILPLLQAARVPFKVALDESVLGQLNEGSLGATQVGKFITIYPSSDAVARRLAERLVDATRGFHGPVVATDLRLGDVIYARYGSFRPVIVRDRLGRHASYVRGTDGRLQRDEYMVPFSMPPGRRNPFESMLHEASSATAASRGRKILGPGFLILDVLKAHPKGAVYRALDVRSRDEIDIWIVKEGRQWCLADRHGRDMRTRLRHQARLHAELRGRVPIPDAGAYFEVDGNGYLPIRFLRGKTLAQIASEDRRGRLWGALHPRRRRSMLQGLAGAVDAVGKLHAAGYVHRDLSGGNILIRGDGQVFLLDLELAHSLDDGGMAFGLGTPGFMSPDQRARRRCTPADDVFGVGALTLLVLTGIDPRRITFAAPADRTDQWRTLARGADPRLIDITVRALDSRADRRPALSEIRATLKDVLAEPVPVRSRKERSGVVRETAGLRRAVREGLRGLLHRSLTDESSGLWMSEQFDEHDDAPDRSRRRELRRSANRGIAGVLYVLGRLARHGHRTDAMVPRARHAAEWLLAKPPAPDLGMPGLHFGEAGVAVALAEAVAGGLVDRTPAVERFMREALSGALDWPDLTHGAAGQGIAALYCGDRMGDARVSALAARCAEYLIRAQRPAGHWTWPSHTMGSRDVYTGFAHGVAGVTYFVAEYARRTGAPDAERAWRRGAKWLMDRAERLGASLTWPNSTARPDHWTWWCHGPVGIAVLFLRLFEQTNDARFADIARRALGAHPADFLAVNLSQCHGASGVGDVYLDAHRVLGDRRWRQRAESVLDVLWALRRSSKSGGAAWLVESPYAPTADLMVGCGGVVHFLLRASIPGSTMGLPLLLDPLNRR